MPEFERKVEVVEGPKGELCECDFPGAVKYEAFAPKSIESLPDGGWLVDFGVDMSGWARFAPRDAAPLKGRRLDFRYDEAQTAQALAISCGLCETETEREGAARQLRREIAEAECHFNVGIIGMDRLCTALPMIGESRLMYRMLVNPTEPSPRASWLDRGLTTLGENFWRTSSLNHVMFGTYAAWAYADLAGIKPGDTANSYVIEPHVVRELTYVRAATDFGRGKIRSEWRTDGNRFSLEVEVPIGTTAHVVLPDGSSEILAGGVKQYSCELAPEPPLETFRLSHRHDPMFWVDTAGEPSRLPYGAVGDAHKVRNAWNTILRRTMLVDADDATYRAFYSAVYRLYSRVVNVADEQGFFKGADGQVHKAGRRRHMRIALSEAAAPDVYAFWSFTAAPRDSDDFLWSPVEAAACGDKLRYLPGVADGYFKEHRGCDYGQMWPVIVRKIKEESADEDSFSAALQLGAALGRSDDIVGVDKIKNGLKSPLDSEGNGGEDDIATVWATLGLHPVAPCSNLFRLAEPKLRYARLRVFEKNGSDNILRLRVVNGVVDRVFLNGKEIVNRTVRRSDLFKGGELLFERAVH